MSKTDVLLGDALHLCIAGLRLALRCQDERILSSLRRRYAIWLCRTPAQPRCQVEVGAATGPVVRREATPIASFAEDGRCLFGRGVVSADLQEAWLQAPFQGAAASNALDVDYFLRAVVALLAYESGGMLVHASGFLRAGQAVVFAGQSGAGKSTTVRLSQGLPSTCTLGDDLILLLPKDGRWWAFATPFWNPETPMSWQSEACQSGPLAALCYLTQDTRAFVEALSPARAAAELMSKLPVVPLDHHRAPALLQRVMSLTSTVPVGELHFRLAPDLWEAIDAFIAMHPSMGASSSQ